MKRYSIEIPILICKIVWEEVRKVSEVELAFPVHASHTHSDKQTVALFQSIVAEVVDKIKSKEYALGKRQKQATKLTLHFHYHQIVGLSLLLEMLFHRLENTQWIYEKNEIRHFKDSLNQFIINI